MGKLKGAERPVTSCVRTCPGCKSANLERQGLSRALVGSWEDPFMLFWLMKCRSCGRVFEYRELSGR